MTLQDFLNAVNGNVHRIHAYKLGHDGSDGQCDCIGQIIGAVRLTGTSWPWTHGSNYAARYRTANLHYVDQAYQLELGNLVYKARKPGDDKYDLPSTYSGHPDQNDYYHVGVVTSVDPLVITHCTSVDGGIKRDNTLGAWHYTGSLNQIKEGGGSMLVDYQAVVIADSGTTVNLRKSPSTKASVQKTVRVGTVVEVTEEYDDEWAKVNTDGLTGYMMRKFLEAADHPATDKVTLTLDYDVALALYWALQSIVKE